VKNLYLFGTIQSTTSLEDVAVPVPNDGGLPLPFLNALKKQGERASYIAGRHDWTSLVG
jgi:hypothetical protein